MTPEQIHKTGLQLVAELSAGIDTALKAQGFATGTVGQRLASLAAIRPISTPIPMRRRTR